MVEGVKSDGSASVYTYNAMGYLTAYGDGNVNKKPNANANYHAEKGVNETTYTLDYTSVITQAIMEYAYNGEVSRNTYGLDKISETVLTEAKGNSSSNSNKNGSSGNKKSNGKGYLNASDTAHENANPNSNVVSGGTAGSAGTTQTTSSMTVKDKYFFHYDRMGSVVSVTDSKNKSIATTAYDEWGNVESHKDTRSEVTGLDETISYAGHDYDGTLGQYFAQARMYNPETKRFNSEDPTATSGVLSVKQKYLNNSQSLDYVINSASSSLGTEKYGSNLYQYCLSNPLAYTDPNGYRATLRSINEAKGYSVKWDNSSQTITITTDYGDHVLYKGIDFKIGSDNSAYYANNSNLLFTQQMGYKGDIGFQDSSVNGHSTITITTYNSIITYREGRDYYLSDDNRAYVFSNNRTPEGNAELINNESNSNESNSSDINDNEYTEDNASEDYYDHVEDLVGDDSSVELQNSLTADDLLQNKEENGILPKGAHTLQPIDDAFDKVDNFMVQLLAGFIHTYVVNYEVSINFLYGLVSSVRDNIPIIGNVVGTIYPAEPVYFENDLKDLYNSAFYAGRVVVDIALLYIEAVAASSIAVSTSAFMDFLAAQAVGSTIAAIFSPEAVVAVVAAALAIVVNTSINLAKDVNSLNTAQAKAGNNFSSPSNYSSNTSSYKFNNEKDYDFRGTGKTYEDALELAFKLTGEPKGNFKVTKWGKDKYGKSFPVEWRSDSGAEVSVDLGHDDPAPSSPHIGYQSGGKRTTGGAVRGHIFVDDVPYNR
jgi:RHS repeat-associated protein